MDLTQDVPDHGGFQGFSDLPQEIVDQIIGYLFPSQENRGGLLLVNWAVYNAALPHVYNAPNISSRNLLRFSETISSRQSTYAVQSLNLQKVIHGAKASQMSRVLRKCSKTLREFYAPQVGFTQSAFRAIGLLHKIRVLDLGAVSEKVELSYFLAAIAKAETLEVIQFPRFSKNTEGLLKVRWPPKLRHIGLSGSINDELLSSELPLTVESVSIQHCPCITLATTVAFLERLGPQLRTFSASYPLSLPSNAFDQLLVLCPGLIYFKGYVDYFTRALFQSIPDGHPLETLVLDSAGGLLNRDNKISADDVSSAIVEGKLNRLRRVRWSLQVGWRQDKSDVRDLGELLADADDTQDLP